MTWLSDSMLARLKQAADWPELDGARYAVIEPIGRGGMGSVYRVEDRELKRDVALKVLSDRCAAPDAGDRMLREARILARLEHPGIVPIHDVGRLADGRLYYVMKCVRGQRLDHAAAQDMPLTEKLRIVQRICETVAFAHSYGFVHRDLKPQNIMVGPFGEVLVLDWGVAKALRDSLHQAGAPRAGDDSDDEATVEADPAEGMADALRREVQTQGGSVVGTRGYMSPEQARGEIDRVGFASDVYGIGAILHFLLTGGAPAGGDEPEMAGTRARGRLRASTTQRPGDVPRPLAAISRKALAAGPADRYASATALSEDIGRFLTGERVAAYRENLAERFWRFVWKYRTPILLVLAYLTMRILFALWMRAKG